ncbi:MAG: LysR family hydrogen peroxide-inducible transcriptional activator [Enterobacterales bacterium]|jgi:LysR family hydrogen peroxide-inducible transcriptional activator
MNSLRDFKYLIAVAETLHFGKAAEQCHVSQPTLSGQLKKLEDSLGFAIFERTNRQVTVTTKGKIMVNAARDIVEAQAGFRQKAKELSTPYAGELRLGLIPTLAPYLLPKIMPQLNEKLPQLNFFLYELQANDLLLALERGKLDALILPWLPEMSNFKKIDLFDEMLLLVLPTKHPLNRKDKITLSDLRGEQVLTLKDGHCLRDQTQGYCFAAGAEEDKRFSATSLETLRYMIASGTALTLMPKLATLNRDDDKIVYRHFIGKEPYRKIVLLTRKTSAENKSLVRVAEVIKQLKI